MKGQANVFGVFIGGSIMLLIVGMVLALTYMFIAQTDAVVGGLNTTTSTGADIYNATAGVAATLSQAHPVITAFGVSTAASTYNQTLDNGNASANATRTKLFTLSTPVDNGAVSGGVWTVRIVAQNGTGMNVSAGGTNLGVLITGITNYTIPTAARVSPLNITSYHYGADISNITNITVEYRYFVATTNYTQNNNLITTTNFNGTVRAAFSYASAGANTDSAVAALGNVQDAVDLFPQWLVMAVFGIIFVALLSLVMGIVVFVKQGGLIGGGLQ